MGPVNTMGQDSLARAVREAGIDVPPLWFDEVGSTNDEARRLAQEGAPEWTVVAARHQTAGRGRLGRDWLDVPGRSLLCSVILRPHLGPNRVHTLTMAAAVALLDAAGLPWLAAKWPNDIVAGERKCAGILAEAEVRGRAVRHVVLGVGVNVSGRPEPLLDGHRATATSLAAEGAVIEPFGLLAGFMRSLRSLLEADGFPLGVVGAYRARCATIGRRVRATTVSGDAVEGRAIDVDEHGLYVEARNGSERVSFGQVIHLE